MKKGTKNRVRRIFALILAFAMLMQQTAVGMATETELTTEAVTEAAAEMQTEAKTTEAPATEAPTEAPATEAVTEAPATEAVTEAPAAEAVTEAPATEVVTEAPATESETEAPETEPATEAVTEAPATEAVTEAPAETELVTEAASEAATEPASEAATEAVSEIVTEAESEPEIVLDTVIKQEVFQKTADDVIQPMVKYTVKVTNRTEGAEAKDVSVKVLLADMLSYVKEEGETPELSAFGTLADAAAANAFAEGELTEALSTKYAQGSAVLWKNQTIAQGAEKEFVFFASVKDGTTDTKALRNAWIVNGKEQTDESKIQWFNTELLTVKKELPSEFKFEDGKMIVTATLSDPNILPEGATFVVEKVEPTEEEKALLADSLSNDEMMNGYAVYDMHFEVDGVEVEPENGTVAVNVQYKQALQLTDNAEENKADDNGALTVEEGESAYKVLHIVDGTEVEDVTDVVNVTDNGQVDEVGFTTDSFSRMALLSTQPRHPISLAVNVRTFLAGRDLKDDDFTFSLAVAGDMNGNLEWINGKNDIRKSKNKADGSVSFEAITFTDCTKEYQHSHYFLVKEELGAKAGITYDKSEYIVVVNVPGLDFDTGFTTKTVKIKDMDGASVNEEHSAPEIAFHNEYEKVVFGNYSLEGFLNGYNVFAFGDVKTDTHFMGGALIQGSFTNSATGFADGTNLPPSYIKGKVNSPNGPYSSRGDSITNGPLYVGADENDVEVKGTGNDLRYWMNDHQATNASKPAIYETDYEYLKFDTAETVFDQAAIDLQKGAIEPTVGSDSDGAIIIIQAGTNVVIDAALLASVGRVNIVGGIDNPGNTIINVTASGTFTLPKELIDGDQKQPKEQLDGGTSIVWNLPNATDVTIPNQNWFGHVLAPGADIHMNGGNYNGTLIGQNITLTGSEGHCYPYRGQGFTPAESRFDAKKTVDGKTPTAAFSFQMERIAAPSGAAAFETRTASNHGENIDFGKINYGEGSQGEYWYKITEDLENNNKYAYDNSQYLMHVVIEPQEEGGVTHYTATTNEAFKVVEEGTEGAEQKTVNGKTYHVVKLPSGTVPVFNNRELTEVSGSKTWNVPEGTKLPESITVILKRNGEQIDTKAVTEADGWSYKWENLPLYSEDGKTAYTYTVDEGELAGYTKSVDGYNLTNTKAGETDVSGTKTWNAPEGTKLPESITVILKRNGEQIDTKAVTEADGWSYKWEKLPLYSEDGKTVYTYTVDEDVPEGFTKSVDGYNLINTIGGKTEVNGTKTWNAPADKIPDSLTVKLLRNGEEYRETVLTKETGWTYSWENLPLYSEDGKTVYTYTVDEDVPEGFTKSVDGYNLINTIGGKTEVNGTKTWNAPADKIPDSLTVKLLRNGEAYRETVLRKETGWTYSWKDLPLYSADGKTKYTYTVDEKVPEGFTKSVDGYNLINTIGGKTEVSGTKTWNVPEGTELPEGITVILVRNDGVIQKKTVTADDDWSYKWENLPQYDEKGNLYTYTIDEDAVAGYAKEIRDYDLINTITDKMTVSGTKTWNVPEGTELPESVTIILKRDGVQIDTKTVTAADNWTYEWTDLPLYSADGKTAYAYTVDEADVEGYEKTIAGYNITNTIKGETSVSGAKTWQAPEGTELPESITVILLQNGEEYDTKEVNAGEDGSWTYSWEKLPMYSEDGKTAYTYTIDEADVEGYTKTIDGTNLINTIVGKTEISGTKTWNVPEGIEKPQITVELYCNGEKAAETVLVEDKYSFTDLEKYDEKGQEYVYTVKEAASGENAELFFGEQDGSDFTNTYVTASLLLEAQKSMARPESELGTFTFDLKDADGKVLQTAANDADGKIAFAAIEYTLADVGEHTYTVSEQIPDERGIYIYDKTIYTVTVTVADNEDGTLKVEKVITKDGQDAEGMTFTNDTTTVKFDKADPQGRRLAGVELTVKDADGKAIDTWTTDGETLHDITGMLECGKTYTLEETKAPVGYALAAPVTFTVNADGKTLVNGEIAETVIMTDSELRFNVNKTDVATGGEVEGAELTVYEKQEDGTLKEVESWTSKKNETHDFGDKLEAGKSYVLKEEVAPQGYAYTSDIEFTVEKDGTVTTTAAKTTDEAGNDTYLVEDAKLHLQVNKVELADNSKEVDGAELTLYDENGSVIDRWTSKTGETHDFGDKLETGRTYTLKETVTPEGYLVTSDITFTVEKDGTIITTGKSVKDAAGVDVYLVEDDRKPDTYTGSLEVTKSLIDPDGNAFGFDNVTFYVALFADAAKTQRISDVMPITFNGTSGMARFEKLGKGTYYVAETDESGTPLPDGVGVKNGARFSAEFVDGDSVTLESDSFAAQLHFNNQFYEKPEGNYYEGELWLTKKVMLGSEPMESTDTFYAGVFSDAECTELYALVELAMNGSDTSETKVIKIPKIGEDPSDGMTFYIRETDENGTPLDEETIEFQVSVDQPVVTVSGEDPVQRVTITNTFEEEEETEIETETETEEEEEESESESEKTAPRTGDETDYMMYLLLMALSAGAVLIVLMQKRRERNAR